MKKIQFKKGNELYYPVVDGGNSYANGVKTSASKTIYLDANSKTGGDGTIGSPFSTLEDSVDAVEDNVETDIVVSGDLHFTETVEISANKKINIIGNGKSSFLGTKLFTMEDRSCSGEVKLYVGDVCPQWIFVDGQVRYPASTSRDDLYKTTCSGVKDTGNDTMTSIIDVPVSDAVKLAAIDYSEVWITILWMWMSYKCRIDHIDTTNGKIYCVQGIGTANGNVLHAMTGTLRIILENANISECAMFNGEDLWQKGTYYVKDGYLYYKYLDNEDIYGNIEVPFVETLISAEGNVSIYNLNVGKTNHDFDNTCNEGVGNGYSGRQACARFNAAIELNGSSTVMFCKFFGTTNHAIKLLNSAHDCVISNNDFSFLGCSSIVLGYVPLQFKTNIPSTAPDNILVENNTIVTVGRIYAGACGLSIFWASNYKIRYNVIRNTYYTGINTGYTWTNATNPNADGLIEYNVIDLIGTGVQALYDGGAFYNLGNQSGLVVRYNIVSNVYGLVPSNDSQNSDLALDGYFIDESSANITIEKNLFYHCKSFYRFNVNASTVYFNNNICFDDFVEVSGRTSGSLAHNAFLYNHAPSSNSAFNNNIWYKIGGGQGSITWDSNGVAGDPFYDAENKDYRIEDAQVATAGGFTSFIPKVIGRWSEAKLSSEEYADVVYYLTNYWNGNLPQ